MSIIHTGPPDAGKRELKGCTLIFSEDMTEEECKEILRRMEKAGLLEHMPKLNSFDPAWGYPCFYIP